MATFLATIAIFALLMGGMALGLMRGRVLRGSCGGSSAGEDCSCSAIKREQCARREAARGIVPESGPDGHHHLDVLSQDEDLR